MAKAMAEQSERFGELRGKSGLFGDNKERKKALHTGQSGCQPYRAIPQKRGSVGWPRGTNFAEGFAAMKKPDAVDYAHKAVKDTGWLPAHIRVVAPDVKLPDTAEINQFPVAAE